jgi:hypothetical protein
MQIPKEFNQFTYHSIHVGAFTNEEDKIKKYVGRPKDVEINSKKHYMVSSVYVPHLYLWRPTNGINIDCSNISSIDVDDPENCTILDQLIQDSTFYVKTNRGFHFYFIKTAQLEEYRNRHLGIIDLNKSNLFYVPTYKHQITGEEFHYSLVKAGPLIEMPKYAIDYCLNLISFNKSQKTKTRHMVAKEPVPETIICSTYTTSLLSLELFEVVAKMYFDNGDFASYETWSKAGYALKHLNNSAEAFDIFCKYSRMVSKYASATHEDLVKAFGRKYDTNFDPTGIFHKCRSINRTVFNNKLRRVMNKIIKYQPELIDTKYLWDRSDIFDSWIQNKTHKILGIHSSYGTGKTVAFKHVIEKYYMDKTLSPHVEAGQNQIVVVNDTITFAQPKTERPRVLFINYRKSNTQAQAEDFKSFGFKNYLETPKELWDDQDMFIIQLDSIHHLSHKKPYDMVVLDEVEGILSHFSFDKLDQTVVHSRLLEFISKAKKVIMLDGDIGSRTFDFVSTLPNNPEFKFYKNVHQPNKKHFVVWNRNDREEFIEAVEKDLAAGDNVVLICMDRGDSSLYNERFKDRYETMVHNSKERNAHVLRNVKVEWRKCRLVIYSPTVEAGIDFSLPDDVHFTRLYGMMSTGSTSVRGFSQMMSRVRQFKDNTVNLYNSLPNFASNDMLLDFKTVRDTLYKFVPEVNNLVTILIHNHVERQNSQDHFCTVLADLIDDKGHTYEIRKAVLKKMPNNEAKKALELNMIIGAKEINEAEHDELQSKLRHNQELTKDENYSMLKYIYMTRFNINEISNDGDLDDFYGKLSTLINWRKLTNTNPLEPEISKYLKHIDFDTVESMKKLIGILGYEIEKRVIVSHPSKTYWMSEIKEDVKTMLNQTNVMLQLGCTKFVSDQTFHKTLANYLGRYGFKLILSIQKDRSIAGKRFKDYQYEITEIEAISHLLDTTSKKELEEMEYQFDD